MTRIVSKIDGRRVSITKNISGYIRSIPRDVNYGFIAASNLPDHIFYFENFLRNNLLDNLVAGTEVVFESHITHQEDNKIPTTNHRSVARNILVKPRVSENQTTSHVENTATKPDNNSILRILDRCFHDAIESESHEDFEDSIFTILRFLGIHYIFRFPRQDQQGNSDGFFRISGLAVVYDCTLNRGYLDGRWRDKTSQVNNYVSTLERGYMDFTYSHRIRADFSGSNKQVWIITRDKSEIIQQKNDIIVKEVNVMDIIKITGVSSPTAWSVYRQEPKRAVLGR